MNEQNNNEINPASRKKDHIDLAFKSNMLEIASDPRFLYEPAFSGNDVGQLDLTMDLAGKRMEVPIWVSSMTGGTEKAKDINIRLAKACQLHGLGMGLGSCRSLLEKNDRLDDFAVRKYIGDQPLYANLGIAQLEELILTDKLHLLDELVKKLEADGLIIHINPLQEWTQPEGDIYKSSPLDSIKRLLDHISFPVIVKEVGQGMGPKSIKAFLELPLAAFDFAAYGGTNFAKLELLRGSEIRKENLASIMYVGHKFDQMITWTNQNFGQVGINTDTIIISGGVKSFLDGYYCIKRSKFKTIYGKASPFLKYALLGEEALNEYIALQISGLKLSHAFLEVNEDY